MLYIDSSALVKLVAEEAESSALARFVDGRAGELVTSVVTSVEVWRAARRVGAAEAGELALRTVDLVELAPEVRDLAVAIEPSSLRTLDAIHLATALALGDELESLIAYDRRLVDAARANGVDVVSPR